MLPKARLHALVCLPVLAALVLPSPPASALQDSKPRVLEKKPTKEKITVRPQRVLTRQPESPAEESQPEPEPPPELEPWTTEDVLDERISVDAQYALMRMMLFGDLHAAVDGSAMLSAVKDGDLAAIYQAYRKMPALRIEAQGSYWWEAIPTGFDAICYKEPPEAPPIIIYRKGIGGIRERLDPALRGAWASCGIPAKPPRPYHQTIAKPPPPPPPVPPDLPPPPDSPLTIAVTSQGSPLPGAKVTVTHVTETFSGVTDGGGYFTCSPPAGEVTVFVLGPTVDYELHTARFSLLEDTATGYRVDLGYIPPPELPEQAEQPEEQESACSPVAFSEVMAACGKSLLGESLSCVGDAKSRFADCALELDWRCGVDGLTRFKDCELEVDHRKKLQQCTEQANASSGCSFPIPP